MLLDLRIQGIQNEQFSEETEFILRYTEKEVCEANDLPLSYQTLMNGHKNSVYQEQNAVFTNQLGIRNCHKMTNCEQFRTKCCVKISATLTLASMSF